MKRFMLIWLGCFGLGCEFPNIPSGWLGCSVEGECPEGYVCRWQPASCGDFCYKEGELLDSLPLDAACTVDGGSTRGD